jgi:hypothetical protein
MKKLLPLMLCTLFLSNIIQTYANPPDQSFKGTNWSMDQLPVDAEKSEGITVTENYPIPKIISHLLIETGWTPNSINTCAVRLPKRFYPNPLHGQLLDVKHLRILKIEVKIYNNWGIKVAESTLSGENHLNYSSKKLSLKQNELNFNQEMKEGTYYYVLDICCFNGEKTIKEGEIRLLKTQKK